MTPVVYRLDVRCDTCGKKQQIDSHEPYNEFHRSGWRSIFGREVCSRECASIAAARQIARAWR